MRLTAWGSTRISDRHALRMLTAFFCAAVFLLPSCSGHEPTEPVSSGSGVSSGSAVSDLEQSSASGTLRLWMQAPESLNPLATTRFQWSRMTWLFYESLYRIGPDQRAVPVLAAEHEVSADGLTHTVRLKSGIPFHDGTILSSLDVAATAAFIFSSGNADYRAMLRGIAAVGTPDARTVVFTLSAPDPFFEYALCFPILQASTLRDAKAIVFPGTGPYRIDRYDAAAGLEASLFRDHRDAAGYRITRITAILLKDSREAMEAFSSDRIDIVLLNDSLYGEYYLRNDLAMSRFPGGTFLFFQLNQGKGRLLADEGRSRYMKALFGDSSLYEGIAEILCIPSAFPFLGTSGVIHEGRCADTVDFTSNADTFPESGALLKICYLEDDPIEQKVIANLERILTKNAIRFTLMPLDRPGYEKAVGDKSYDIIIRQAVTGAGPDPAWLFLHASRPVFAGSDTLDTGNSAFSEAAAEIAARYDDPGTSVAEYDLCAPMYRALGSGPFYGIGFKVNAALLSKRIQGTIRSDAFDEYNDIKETWVWSGH